jgi:hypothetical protein
MVCHTVFLFVMHTRLASACVFIVVLWAIGMDEIYQKNLPSFGSKMDCSIVSNLVLSRGFRFRLNFYKFQQGIDVYRHGNAMERTVP